MARTARAAACWTFPPTRLGFIILKAREYDVKEGDSDPDEGSNPIDDGNTDILTDNGDDPVREELLGAIRELNDEERMQLVALAWLGRGTFEFDEWRTALDTARSEHSRNARPNICWACRCWAIIWKTGLPCSTKASSMIPTRAKAWTTKTSRWAVIRLAID